MKNLLIFICVFFIGCGQNIEKVAIKANTLDSIINFYDVSTFEKPTILRKLPATYSLDSIRIEDTTLNFSVAIFFPKSIDSLFNKALKQFVDYRVSIEKPDKKSNTSFSMWLTDFKISNKLIHCLFREESLTEGAAHYYHSYSTFNYNRLENEKIVFTDIFKFSKSNSKQSFCNKVNGYKNSYDDSDGFNDGINPEDIDNNLNYCIWNNKLTVYPYSCCVGDKLLTVDLDSIKGFLNLKFKNYFDLDSLK